MRIVRVVLVIFTIWSTIISREAKAMVVELTFDELVEKSDLIVEGCVVEQVSSSVEIDGLSFSKSSSFKISKVYKGGFENNEIIVIYSHSDFVCDVSALKKNQEYVLFLKQKDSSFVDVHYGRGEWSVVVDEKGKKRVKSFTSDMLSDSKRLDEGIPSKIDTYVIKDWGYAEFILKLTEKLYVDSSAITSKR